MSQILRISTANTDRITLVNAGLTQNAVCAPIVYLEAHVIGDTSRHTSGSRLFMDSRIAGHS